MKKTIAVAAASLLAVAGMAACSSGEKVVEEEPVDVVEEVTDGDETVVEEGEGELEVEEEE